MTALERANDNIRALEMENHLLKREKIKLLEENSEAIYKLAQVSDLSKRLTTAVAELDAYFK